MYLNHSRFLPVLLVMILMSTSVFAGPGKDLRQAAWAGDIDKVKQLLADGVNPDSPGKLGGTPLIKAAKGGHIAVVQLLLFYGADPTIKNKKGRTAIDTAERHEYPHILQILRNASAEQSVTVRVGTADSERFNNLMTSALLGRRWKIETTETNKITAVYYRGARAYKVAASLNGGNIVINFLRGYGSNKMNYLYNLRSDLLRKL